MTAKDFAEANIRWWKAGDDHKDKTNRQLADALCTHLDAVEAQQEGRNAGYKRNLRLYQGRNGLPGKPDDTFIVRAGKVISLNVIASVGRSLRAKITKSRPAPWALTDSGTEAQIRAADMLQQFLIGAIYECGVYRQMERTFDLADIICGSADIKVYPDLDAGTIRVETVYPWEAPIDDQDAYYGTPRSRYQIAHMDRDVVREIFGGDVPKQVLSAIDTAERSKGDPDFGFVGSADQIKIREGWHIPSGKSAKDGMHLIAIPGAGLFREEWKRDHAPFARFCPEPEPVGFHGTSVADELAGIQMEIDDTLAKIREGHELGGHVMLLLESGSKVNKSKLTNLLHSTVEYTGTPPQPVVVPAVSPETYEWVWSLVDRAYQIIGASQLSASAQLPAGLQQASGKALRTFHDVESERFSYLTRAYERLLLDVCDLIIDAAEDLAARNSAFSVRFRGNEGIKRIKWSDIKLARDAYVLQIQPKSYLDESGTGRVQAVQDMLDLGVVSASAVPMLTRDPDLRSLPDAYESNVKLARWQIAQIRDGASGIVAESYQDLQVALTEALSTYTKWQTYSDVPAAAKDALRAYIDGIEAALEPAAPPAPPPGAMPPMDPAAMGAPPMPPGPDMPAAPMPGGAL